MTRLWTSQVSKQAPIQGSTCHSSSALAIRNVDGSILRWRFLQASIHLFRANQSRLPRSFHPSLSPVRYSSLTVPPQSAPEQSAAGRPRSPLPPWPSAPTRYRQPTAATATTEDRQRLGCRP